MEVRTAIAKVERLVGAKGVAIVETTTNASGASFDMHATVWLRENHGLKVGDQARFLGFLGVKKREHNGKTYVDTNINNGQIVADSIAHAPTEDATAGAWATATPGAAWGGAE